MISSDQNLPLELGIVPVSPEAQATRKRNPNRKVSFRKEEMVWRV